MAETVLQARGIDKSYGPVKALRSVDFELRSHEIHGLMGENGSGKSTLLKVLAGQLAPDAGGVYLDGERIRFGDAADALAAGIATVTQETTLVPELSVAENILLGPRKPKRWWGIDWRRTRSAAVEMLGRLQLDIDPSVPAGSLRPEQQQMVEITRALSMDARVVILDEPTSSLPDDQVAALFEVVRALRDNGVAVAFVSHRFNEIFDLVDHVSVLRDGLLVGGGPIGEYDRSSLVRQMIGQELENLTFETRESKHTDPVLRVKDFHVPGRVHGVDVAVERGEIVGVAGLVGSGRSALLNGLFGLESEAFGEVEIDGATGVAPDPRAAMNRGFGYVPADRKTLGAVMDMSVRENLLMAQTADRVRVARPSRGTERDTCRATIERFRIVTPNQDNAVKNLSGGNQQKVVLAKWIATRPKVLMLDEPTRGVDVGAKAEIYKLLNQIKEEDVAILVSSSESEELLLLCDTILVMHRGRLAASLSREEATDSKIAYYGMGHG